MQSSEDSLCLSVVLGPRVGARLQCPILPSGGVLSACVQRLLHPHGSCVCPAVRTVLDVPQPRGTSAVLPSPVAGGAALPPRLPRYLHQGSAAEAVCAALGSSSGPVACVRALHRTPSF